MPSSICSVMPPHRPPTTGRPFQRPSLTVSPKPSRSDFCITTSAARWNALICTAPTCWMFDSRWMSWSPARASFGELPVVEPLGVVGRHRTREHELRVGNSLAHDAERLDHADRVLPRVEPAHLARRSGRSGRRRTACTSSSTNGIGELEVLHRQRVDARRRDHDASIVQRRRERTPASSTPTRRTARRTAGRTPTPSGSASVRSMWQRQIHFVLSVRRRRGRATNSQHRGGLRVVDHDEVPLALELQRVVEDASRGRCAPSAVVHSTSAPCSALCTVLVTAKNSSLPWITCHSASMPDVAQQRTWVASSSATPPPYAVAFTWRTRAPCSGSASSRMRSSVPGSTDARVVVEVLVEQRHAFEHSGSPEATSGRRSSGQSIATWSRVASCCPDKFRGTLASRRSRGRDGSRARGAPASTTSSSCRSPTAARARSTRCSPHAAVRGARRACHRSARRSGRRGVGRAARRHRGRSRWRARAGSRSSRGRNDPLARDDARHRRADRRRASRGFQAGHRRRRRERDDRRRARRGRGARLVACRASRSRSRATSTTRVPRRRDGVRTAEGRDAPRRSRCSTRRLAAARRAVPRRAPASTCTTLDRRRRGRRARRRARRDRRASSCPASTSSPRRSGSRPRSTAPSSCHRRRASSTRRASRARSSAACSTWAADLGVPRRRGRSRARSPTTRARRSRRAPVSTCSRSPTACGRPARRTRVPRCSSRKPRSKPAAPRRSN